MRAKVVLGLMVIAAVVQTGGAVTLLSGCCHSCSADSECPEVSGRSGECANGCCTKSLGDVMREVEP